MRKQIIGYCRNPFTVKSKIARVLWNVTWLFLFRPTPRGLMTGWRVFLLRLFGAKIEMPVAVLPSVKIWAPWNLVMEKYTCISENVDCYNVEKVTIQFQAVVSQDSFLCTASHDIRSRNYDLIHKPIVIGPAAWVTARAIILPGVTVGEGAVVGCGSVVTKDVEPWAIVAGNPAKVVGKREFREEKQ